MRLSEIIPDALGKEPLKALVVMRGFKNQMLTELSEFQHLSKDKGNLPDSNEFISKEYQLDLLKRFISFKDRITWIKYEELSIISRQLNEFEKIWNGKILIIDNNLFNRLYPIDISEEVAQATISELENESSTESDDETAVSLYTQIQKIEDKYFASFVDCHIDKGINVVNAYNINDTVLPISTRAENIKSIAASDIEFHKVKSDVQLGLLNYPIQVLLSKTDDLNSIKALNIVAAERGQSITYYSEPKIALRGNINAINYLRKFWGSNASYRDLKLYLDPDRSEEICHVSQGAIIAHIINQCEQAINNDNSYSDTFITAPTGSGKSVLFQIPAAYLEDQYKAVTIVITPLISLMQDQVMQLKNRGVSYAASINSERSTFNEKEKVIEDIRQGKVSLLYLSPEMLLSTGIDNFLCGRKLGLLVVDEAHLVTTWGRDFRSDYWFLGDYIKKLRNRLGMKFPVLCLTATAVYQGNEDIVISTIQSLNLRNYKIILGSVKRDNIKFAIHHISKVSDSISEFKAEKTIERIENYIKMKQKAIVYCPFVSQVNDITRRLDINIQDKVGSYTGQNMPDIKHESVNGLRSGSKPVIVATKAFGMGIDIPDIDTVYHYAPTGNLSDYIQEVGRAARTLPVGYAETDFTKSDLKYVKKLYGLSSIRQYQLKEVLAKLYSIYKEKKRRNLLISPDNFSYLFSEKDLDNKTKSALMLLANDLENKYNYPVLIVRARSLYTTHFLCVPSEIESSFLKEYGEFSKKEVSSVKRTIHSAGRYNCTAEAISTGSIYSIELARLWEEKYSDMSFAQFKNYFFNNLLDHNAESKLSPRVKIQIKFFQDFQNSERKLEEIVRSLGKAFSKTIEEHSFFTKDQFNKELIEALPELKKRRNLGGMILDYFISPVNDNNGNIITDLRFLQQRRSGDDMEYRVLKTKHITLASNLIRVMSGCKPNNGNVFETYLPLQDSSSKQQIMVLSSLLQLFEIATFEVNGGLNPEIFVRINDPNKIFSISKDVNYHNEVLADIERRRKVAEQVLTSFLSKEIDDIARWDLIEKYFLGRDEYVKGFLGITSSSLE